MRNELDIGNVFIVTTDNADGIGEKLDDIVKVSDEITVYFAARVVLKEQWAANHTPTALLRVQF